MTRSTSGSAGRGQARLMTVWLLARHQAAAIVGSAADFGAMIALVELAKLSPPVATLVSALFGGIVNFTISRAWAYRDRHEGTFTSQAGRYALVSGGGAALNAALLAAVLHAFTLPYAVARVAVSIAVSVLYTYPLHVRVIFRVTQPLAAPEIAPASEEPAA